MPRTRDAVTNALFVSDGARSKALGGKLWVASYAASVASGSNLDILVTTGASNVAYVKLRAITLVATTVNVYEGTTVSGAGTTVTPYNPKRDIATSPGTVVTHTPSVSTTGTAVFPSFSIPGFVVDYVTVLEDWMFKANTRYLIRIANASGSTNTCSAILSWYEN